MLSIVNPTTELGDGQFCCEDELVVGGGADELVVGGGDELVVGMDELVVGVDELTIGVDDVIIGDEVLVVGVVVAAVEDLRSRYRSAAIPIINKETPIIISDFFAIIKNRGKKIYHLISYGHKNVDR